MPAVEKKKIMNRHLGRLNTYLKKKIVNLQSTWISKILPLMFSKRAVMTADIAGSPNSFMDKIYICITKISK